MTELGHGSQVVKVTSAHTYELDEHALADVLMKEEIKDLPVVVVSVAGAYRGGKSFLLNFFLRYLSSPPSSREDGSWLGEDSEPLAGFQWRSGIKRTTTGILLWSEPFITTLSSGTKVAVLLVDTQGTFDSKSTVRDCSTIFALSTLISSVQIYNLSQNIQEDDLQHLQLFTEYGKLVKNKGTKAFQVLEFLVRDWQFPEDYPYGAFGGEQLLQEKLEITEDHTQDMKELRLQIRSSFEKVSCFLMPHPGFKVLKSTFKGNIKDISADFRMQLIDLVASLFGPEKLLPKTINGEQVRARDLFQYFKTYMALFNSDTIPNPTSIMKATVEAGFLSAMNEAREIYEKGMNAECGPEQPSVPSLDLKDLHIKYVAAARSFFISKKKMGSKEEADVFLTKLTAELETRLPQFVQSNVGKIQAAINKAKDSYEDAIREITKDQLLCVHAVDLENVHKKALDAAIKTFDAARRNISKRKDEERENFILGFEKRLDLLKKTNDQNNLLIVSILRMEYWQTMNSKSGGDSPLSEGEFKREHEKARAKALADFDLKRNIPNHYTEDPYKFKLTTAINENFIQLKEMNKSKNRIALQAAVEAYDNFMREAWKNRSLCLHPNDLNKEHDNGLCRALEVFRPRRACASGIDYNDEDEVTLNGIIRQRFNEMKSLNDSANEAAVQEAFNVYIRFIDDLCRPTLLWLLIVPMFIDLSRRSGYHEDSKNKAFEVFYSKRRNSGYHSSDPYKDRLEELMNSYFSNNY